MSTNHPVTRSEGFLFVGGLAAAGTTIDQLGATSATTYASGGNGGVTTGVLLALMLFTAGVAALWTNQMAAKWGGQKSLPRPTSVSQCHQIFLRVNCLLIQIKIPNSTPNSQCGKS